MRLWRALKSLGVATLRDGVYLVPKRESLQDSLDEQAVNIRESGGTAYLWEVETLEGKETDAFVTLFERHDNYTSLFSDIESFWAELPNFTETQARRALQQLRRDLEVIRAIDFFPGASLRQVIQAVAEAELAANQQFSPDEPLPVAMAIKHCDLQDFQSRTWATRAQLWVDRVASAWLIQRFIDPHARFIWLATPDDCPSEAVGFDFNEALFTHVGDRVTFEVLLASFELANDFALNRLGKMVHYLDVGGISVPEAAGFETILTGMREQYDNDDVLLANVTHVLDALYAAFGNEVIQ
jgi:hypothetical protein